MMMSSRGVATKRKPLKKTAMSCSRSSIVPDEVIAVVSLAWAVMVATASPKLSRRGVGVEPPEPAVTVAGTRRMRTGLASQLVPSVRWPPCTRSSRKAIDEVAVTLIRSCAAATAGDDEGAVAAEPRQDNVNVGVGPSRQRKRLAAVDPVEDRDVVGLPRRHRRDLLAGGPSAGGPARCPRRCASDPVIELDQRGGGVLDRSGDDDRRD